MPTYYLSLTCYYTNYLMEQIKRDEITELKAQLLLFIEEQTEGSILLTEENYLSLFPIPGKKNISKVVAPPIKLPAPAAESQPEKKAPPQQKIEVVPEITEKKPSPYFELLGKVAPKIKLHQTLLDDSTAKSMATLWVAKSRSPALAILYFGKNKEERQLLENIAFAISKIFDLDSRVINMENAEGVESVQKWEILLDSTTLQRVIACSDDIQKSLYFEKFHQNQQLKEKPLLITDHPKLYLTSPMQKQQLWKRICLFLN